MTALDTMVARFQQKLGEEVGWDRVTVYAQAVKLKDEADEVMEAALIAEAGALPGAEIDLLDELADVVIVAHVAAAILGATSGELLDRVAVKMERNLARTWYPTASGTARHTPE